MYVMAIEGWVHVAWSWCMIGNPSEAGLPASPNYDYWERVAGVVGPIALT